jgi:hypothetical protein
VNDKRVVAPHAIITNHTIAASYFENARKNANHTKYSCLTVLIELFILYSPLLQKRIRRGIV